MTQITLIKRSLRLLGVLAPGEPLPDAERQDAALALQSMLGDWGTQNLTMFATVEETFTLIANQPSYTVGTDGDVDIDRPTFLERISLISNEDPSNPIEDEIELITTAQRWQEVALKSLGGGWPLAAYYQKTFPLAVLWIYPIPDIATLELKLYIRQRVTGFANIATNYTFPDGYEDALSYNLAERLAPEWGVPVPAEVARIAARSFGNIKRVNKQTPEMRMNLECYSDRAGSGAYDWRADE